MSNKPPQFRPSGTIEFEHVTFEPVPAAAGPAQAAPQVDPATDSDPLSITFGRKKDDKPSAAERMLAGATIDWLVAFPNDARPKALCERFAHVANRLAKDWANAAQSAQSLNALIADSRWGSAGYPAQVQAELRRLLQQRGALAR
jgi:hypothetical protein